MTDAGIGSFGGVPVNVAPPSIYPASSQFPERLIARYYHWVHDAAREALLADAGASPSTLETSRLEAVDFIISKEADADGYLVLASTRNEDELIPALASAEDALQTLDASAEWKATNRSSLHTGGTDFFLWLVERKIENPIVDGDLSIAAINGLESRDNRSRQSVLKDEIDGDRPNFLTAVADAHDLGPIRFVLRIPSIPARITLSLWSDGSFVLITGGTHYSIKANVANESVQAVQDLAYLHIPRLRQFYVADTNWSTSRRKDFRLEARRKLETRYATPVT